MLEERDITLDGRSSDKGDRARTEIHMTEWTTDVDDGGAIDEPPMTSQPVLRTARRSALRRSSSRRELYSDARDEARRVRGRDAFVWRGRVLPVGVPIAAAAGLLTWRQRRSARDTIGAVIAAGVLSYLEARLEWGVRRRAYRRRRDTE